MAKGIAALPEQRRLWQVRKLYGGGTPLPPTDPRILALTPEQIEIDLAHLLLDNPQLERGASDGKAAFDPEFAEYERKVDAEEREQALQMQLVPEEDLPFDQYEQETYDQQWVDVEID